MLEKTDDLLAYVEKESQRLGENKDCAVRAMAIVTGYEYDDVQYAFKVYGRRKGKGTPFHITFQVAKALNFSMMNVTRTFKSRTIRTLERELRYRKIRFLPGGRDTYLVQTRGHILAVVDGKVHDWTKGRLHRIVAIYKMDELQ